MWSASFSEVAAYWPVKVYVAPLAPMKLSLAAITGAVPSAFVLLVYTRCSGSPSVSLLCVCDIVIVCSILVVVSILEL